MSQLNISAPVANNHHGGYLISRLSTGNIDLLSSSGHGARRMGMVDTSNHHASREDLEESNNEKTSEEEKSVSSSSSTNGGAVTSAGTTTSSTSEEGGDDSRPGSSGSSGSGSNHGTTSSTATMSASSSSSQIQGGGGSTMAPLPPGFIDMDFDELDQDQLLGDQHEVLRLGYDRKAVFISNLRNDTHWLQVSFLFFCFFYSCKI
jgi:hypothetical protein